MTKRILVFTVFVLTGVSLFGQGNGSCVWCRRLLNGWSELRTTVMKLPETQEYKKATRSGTTNINKRNLHRENQGTWGRG